MSELPAGCARLAGAVTASSPEAREPVETESTRQEAAVIARVGQKAPDFTAPAYYRGSFTSVQLSSFAGKWVLLCFYPGDFTFV